MRTITFYSYKGGTGRSLALANAARYLARLEFKVVALDFDLEAPGLHYKFSSNPEGTPLPVKAGVVDYLHSFIVGGRLPDSLQNFTIDLAVSGVEKTLLQLIPAGRGPSKDYWSKLSRINWHELFYSKNANGVEVFLDLKNRIADELKPDFLLIDSRTGITEMGGVATTLLADKVIALVLPSHENLDGARAVLRSVRRTRRESGAGELETIIALSRLPQMVESKGEQDWTKRIRTTLNEEAEDLKDTLSCSEVFVLHSEVALETCESLRVGSGISPDDSVLLRDYLRLFASIVPHELVEPKVERLIQQAKDKIWENPEGAMKEMEELAESFGHPNIYRALLRFYEVRNQGGRPVILKAQRLWELTRDSTDPTLWQILLKTFEPAQSWKRGENWSLNLDFVEAVWRDAGGRNPEFGTKIATAFEQEDQESRAADLLLEIISVSEPTAEIVSRCIELLGGSERAREGDVLIQQVRSRLAADAMFVEAWAKHVLRNDDKDALKLLLQPPTRDQLGNIRPNIAARILLKAGLAEEASVLASRLLHELCERPSQSTAPGVAELFQELGRFDEFEKTFDGVSPPRLMAELRERFGGRPRRRLLR